MDAYEAALAVADKFADASYGDGTEAVDSRDDFTAGFFMGLHFMRAFPEYAMAMAVSFGERHGHLNENDLALIESLLREHPIGVPV